MLRALPVQQLWSKLEAPAEDVPTLRKRTTILAALHLILSTAAIAVLILVAWRIRHLITLTQRSNVESLLLGFIVVFLLYVLLTTFEATKGSLQILYYRMLGPKRAQPRLQRRAKGMPHGTKRHYADVIVRGPGGQPIEVPLEDATGTLGKVKVDLAQISFQDVPVELPHAFVELVLKTLSKKGELHGSDSDPVIVFWDSINQEQAAVYSAQVSAFDRLTDAVGVDRLWPELRVDKEGVEALRKMIRQAMPVVRESLLIPDIEYSGEFSIPVVPEPLAFMQLKRRVEHADPVASMGCMTAVALTMLALIALVIVAPPWVPGK